METESFVEGDDPFRAIQNDLVTFEFAADFEQVFDERPTDPVFLKTGMDRDIFDMADHAT